MNNKIKINYEILKSIYYVILYFEEILSLNR